MDHRIHGEPWIINQAPTPALVNACGEVTNLASAPIVNYNNVAEWCRNSCPGGDASACPEPNGFIGNLTRVGAAVIWN